MGVGDSLAHASRGAAGHSLALKLRYACFRLLIVEPCQLRWRGIKSVTHVHKTKTPQKGCLCFGGSGWIRTTSGLSQQIYSLPRLSNSGARPERFSCAVCRLQATAKISNSQSCYRIDENRWCGQRDSNPHIKLGRLAY